MKRLLLLGFTAAAAAPAWLATAEGAAPAKTGQIAWEYETGG